LKVIYNDRNSNGKKLLATGSTPCKTKDPLVLSW